MATGMDLRGLNALPAAEAEALLLSCCGSTAFAQRTVALGPFSSVEDLLAKASHVWRNEVGMSGWIESFAAHPRIGSKKQHPSNAHGTPGAAGAAAVQDQESRWCEGEQAAASSTADDSILKELADWNERYEAKFGHVFLICAQGRSSQHILSQLKMRYGNSPMEEVQNACKEQEKITELRILKLLHLPSPQHSISSSGTPPAHPHISTHVLDTVLGRPGAGIEVALDLKVAEDWVLVGQGCTNADGRCGDLLNPALQQAALARRIAASAGAPAVYQLRFSTGEYFVREHGGQAFFPSVSVVFVMTPKEGGVEKVHVPLLLAPFSYSTYRGS